MGIAAIAAVARIAKTAKAAPSAKGNATNAVDANPIHASDRPPVGLKAIAVTVYFDALARQTRAIGLIKAHAIQSGNCPPIHVESVFAGRDLTVQRHEMMAAIAPNGSIADKRNLADGDRPVVD